MPRRIALSGGPGGGKSTAAHLLRREIGESLVVVPETATLLYGGGFPRSTQRGAKVAAQRAIYHVQHNTELAQHSLFPERILLCDRGTVDGAVYWPEDEGNYFEAMGTTLEAELERYEAVVFFETAAVGGISIEGGNPIRNEDNAKAVELDGRLREIWSKHPRFHLIKHNHSFLEKLNQAVKMVEKLINEPPP